jgi:hypothetical protein
MQCIKHEQEHYFSKTLHEEFTKQTNTPKLVFFHDVLQDREDWDELISCIDGTLCHLDEPEIIKDPLKTYSHLTYHLTQLDGFDVYLIRVNDFDTVGVDITLAPKLRNLYLSKTRFYSDRLPE